LNKIFALLCIVILLVPGIPGFDPVLIENNTVWLDTNGDPIMAQGGCIIEVDGTYHWFGPYFVNRGDHGFKEIRHYTSTDLKNWTRESGGELKLGTPTVPFDDDDWVGRPYVLWNEPTSKYVMWIEWSDGEPGTRNKYVVFTADDLYADNAWTYHAVYKTLPDATGTHYTMGDMGMYQEGSDAYLLYTFDKDGQNASYAFLKLSDDFLAPLSPVPGNYVEFSGGTWKKYDGDHREAHAVFKRDGIYYHFSSNTRGFRPSETSYRTATNMIGPWSERKVVPTDPHTETSFQTQHDFVLTVNGSAGTTYVYVGDRWPNLVNPAIEDEEDKYVGTTGYYAWFPITFDENGVPTIHGLDQWYLDVKAETWSEDPSVPAFTLLNP
jgi:hypothetical protein